MGFSPEYIASLPIEVQEGAIEVNRSLATIAGSRLPEVRARDFPGSLIAWKLATLRQSITYRVVDLSESAISEHAAGSYLAAVVLSRAVIETIALFHHLTTNVRKAVEAGDVAAIDSVVMKAAFAARDEQILASKEYRVQSILNAIDFLDRTIPGMRGSYDFLSEMAHPNGLGHQHFYGEMDRKNYVVHLSRQGPRANQVATTVLAGLFGLMWMRDQLREFDLMVAAAQRLPNGSRLP